MMFSTKKYCESFFKSKSNKINNEGVNPEKFILFRLIRGRQDYLHHTAAVTRHTIFYL